jgi:hypothetical protein
MIGLVNSSSYASMQPKKKTMMTIVGLSSSSMTKQKNINDDELCQLIIVYNKLGKVVVIFLGIYT